MRPQRKLPPLPSPGEFTAAVKRIRSHTATAGQLAAYEAGLEQAALEASRATLEAQGVPERLRDNLDEITETPLVKRVRRWLEGDRRAWCLVLAGGVGCGKSTAAALWLWERVELGANSRRWYTAARVASLSRYDGSVEPLVDARSLVLDDLGAEFADRPGNSAERLDYILTEREATYRPILITTNLNAGDFAARYSERIVDRIRAAAPAGGFFEHSGPSLRGS